MPARRGEQTTPTMQLRAAEDSPLARAVADAKRRRKREAVTEAMKQSQRAMVAGERASIQNGPSSSLLARTVAEAKRREKKEMITAVLKESRRKP